MKRAEVFQLVNRMALAEIKLRYQGTYLGLLWVIAHPLALFLVHGMVFSGPLGMKIENYWTYLLGGLLPWVFLSNCLSMSAYSIVGNRELILSLCTRPLLHPYAKVLDNIFSFSVVFFPMVFVFLAMGRVSAWSVLNMIPALALLGLGAAVLACLGAVIQVFARDWAFVQDFALRLGYLATPILYSESGFPPEMRWVYLLNPLYILIRPVRSALLSDVAPWEYFSSASAIFEIGQSAIFCGLVLVRTRIYYDRMNRSITFHL